MATEFELAVMQELSDIKSLATKAAAAAEAANSASVAASTAMAERLFHPKSGVIVALQSDIDEIKDDRLREEKWEKIHNVLHYSLTPIIVAAHAIAKHFGVDI